MNEEKARHNEMDKYTLEVSRICRDFPEDINSPESIAHTIICAIVDGMFGEGEHVKYGYLRCSDYSPVFAAGVEQFIDEPSHSIWDGRAEIRGVTAKYYRGYATKEWTVYLPRLEESSRAILRIARLYLPSDWNVIN